jgi:NitT/TauT family transport system ATP-binding protein
MVFQSFALLPWLTVLANVAFGLELRGEPKASREAKARELVEMVGLSEFADRLPRELSGGMQQRVGLARALAVEPRVLLMDEPFGALDEQTRRFLQEELLRVWEANRVTVVFVTHSMEEAVLLGDRVVLMSARPGTIEEIVSVPLPRPRASSVSDIQRSPRFTEITEHLWQRLRTMQTIVPGGVAE